MIIDRYVIEKSFKCAFGKLWLSVYKKGIVLKILMCLDLSVVGISVKPKAARVTEDFKIV